MIIGMTPGWNRQPDVISGTPSAPSQVIGSYTSLLHWPEGRPARQGNGHIDISQQAQAGL